MGKIVAAVCTSHSPGALGFPENPPQEQRDRTEAACRQLGVTLEKAKPNVIFAMINDHFENFYRNHMPTIAIGCGAVNYGPADHWLEPLRIKKKMHFPGSPSIGEHLLQSLLDQGFDCSRVGEMEYGNNWLMPWILMNPDIDLTQCAVVPIFLNVFTPPLMKYSRAYAFGEALRKAVYSLPNGYRCAFVATGGLSHWPPYWTPRQGGDPPKDPLLSLMKDYQTRGKIVLQEVPDLFVQFDDYEVEMCKTKTYPLYEKSHPLIDAEWDQNFAKHYVEGDKEWLKALTYEYVEEGAGHGGHEILNWVATSGVMNGKTAKLLLYEPVYEWTCGMTYVDFQVAEEGDGAQAQTNGHTDGVANGATNGVH